MTFSCFDMTERACLSQHEALQLPKYSPPAHYAHMVVVVDRVRWEARLQKGRRVLIVGDAYAYGDD